MSKVHIPKCKSLGITLTGILRGTCWSSGVGDNSGVFNNAQILDLGSGVSLCNVFKYICHSIISI
jgi:hypothetical protein